MSFEINVWVNDFLVSIKRLFDERLVFVGLQGSYNRGEATDQSDIDMVVILDQVTPADLRHYSAMLDMLPNREKACGFVSGVQVLKAGTLRFIPALSRHHPNPRLFGFSSGVHWRGGCAAGSQDGRLQYLPYMRA